MLYLSTLLTQTTPPFPPALVRRFNQAVSFQKRAHMGMDVDTDGFSHTFSHTHTYLLHTSLTSAWTKGARVNWKVQKWVFFFVLKERKKRVGVWRGVWRGVIGHVLINPTPYLGQLSLCLRMVDKGPLLTSAIIFYLSIGAAIFQVLEEPNWKLAVDQYNEQKEKVLRDFPCLTKAELDRILEVEILEIFSAFTCFFSPSFPLCEY